MVPCCAVLGYARRESRQPCSLCAADDLRVPHDARRILILPRSAVLRNSSHRASVRSAAAAILAAYAPLVEFVARSSIRVRSHSTVRLLPCASSARRGAIRRRRNTGSSSRLRLAAKRPHRRRPARSAHHSSPLSAPHPFSVSLRFAHYTRGGVVERLNS